MKNYSHFTLAHEKRTKVQKLSKGFKIYDLNAKKTTKNPKNLGHDCVVDLEEGEVLPGEDAGHLCSFVDYLWK